MDKLNVEELREIKDRIMSQDCPYKRGYERTIYREALNNMIVRVDNILRSEENDNDQI